MKCTRRWLLYRTGLTCIQVDCNARGRPTLPQKAREGWGNLILGFYDFGKHRERMGRPHSLTLVPSRIISLPRRGWPSLSLGSQVGLPQPSRVLGGRVGLELLVT